MVADRVSRAILTFNHGANHSRSQEDQSFRSEAAFETWLAANHARETELWLKIHKKDSGLPTVTYARRWTWRSAGDGSDGIKRPSTSARSSNGYAAQAQERVEPDQPRSHRPADRGRPHDPRRSAAGRRCEADGRWDAAYAPIRSTTEATIPDDLRAAIEANPRREDLPDAWPPEPVRAGVPHQQHEDARRTREENRGAGGDAGARRDHRAGTAAVTSRQKAIHVILTSTQCNGAL